ncbi:MAG TPA: SCO family protein [Thiolapillus brandeum]|uniref:SCO family protein n=1 Tax=Thiolapillus brandeum TaxID=1076588 RepID=A0A831NY68_9GAMM|nr:SCO family protein [Thiolapillus brandeum]
MKIFYWLFLAFLMTASTSHAWSLFSADEEERYPGMGGDFTLRSAAGEVSLKDFRGKVVLIYFGYTSCPDVCPTSLGALSAALKKLSSSEMDQIQPLFISIDPVRDDLEKLREYAHYFHPKMIGMTGDLAYLQTLAKRYGAYFRKAEVENSSLGYAVDHSSTIYVVGKDGKLVDMIQHSGSPKRILEHIRGVLAY